MSLKIKKSKKEKPIRFEMYHLRLLSSMVASGISPVEALLSFKNKEYVVLTDLFLTGAQFSRVLGLTTLNKNQMHIELIESAELVGAVPEVLKHIAQSLEDAKSRFEKLISILIYPVIVILISFSLLILILLFVIPNIDPIIKMSADSSTIVTNLLVWASNSLRTFWYVYIVGSISLFVSLIFLLRNNEFKSLLEGFLLKIPKVSEYIVNYQCVQYCSALKLHIEYTHNLPSAFTRIASNTRSKHFKAIFENISQSINSGFNLSAAIDKESKLPQIWSIYSKAGERSSAYVQMFNQLQQYYAQALENQTQFLMKILEPALMMLIGLLVGFLAYGILSPLYGLMNQFN